MYAYTFVLKSYKSVLSRHCCLCNSISIFIIIIVLPQILPISYCHSSKYYVPLNYIFLPIRGKCVYILIKVIGQGHDRKVDFPPEVRSETRREGRSLKLPFNILHLGPNIIYGVSNESQ